MIIAILAVLKAGGAYVPIDPELPIKRKEHILKDNKSRFVLTHSALEDELPSSVMKVICVDEMEDYSQLEALNFNTKMTSGNLAYVIYTSGSTGVPKGVMVEHISVTNYLFGQIIKKIQPTFDSCLFISSYAFDTSISSIFGSLVNGLCLNIISENDRKDTVVLEEIIKRKICLLLCPANILIIIQSKFTFSNINKVIISGECASLGMLDDQNDLGMVVNEYGPTECTVAVSFCEDLKDYKPSNIGRPCVNTKVYIVDTKKDYVLWELSVVRSISEAMA